MNAPKNGEKISYSVARRGCNAAMDSSFVYEQGAQQPAPEPGSFEFFLVERYFLFSHNPNTGTLYSGQVHHRPYPLHEVTTTIHQEGAIALAGFERPERAPDHVVMSPGVDVDVFAIEKVGFEIN